MFKKFKNWLTKKLLKSFINDLLKKMPIVKEKFDGWWEVKSDEIFENIVEKIKEYVKANCK